MQDRPLSPALQEVWDLLNGRSLTAKELATRLLDDPRSAEAIRKRVEAIRKTGRRIEILPGSGYYRVDAPQWVGAA